jgi:plasmid stability protein
MAKDATVTIRLPVAVKRKLQARARREGRSLSAEIVGYLEREVATEPSEKSSRGKLLGCYAGTRVPTEDDFMLVRRLLWGSLGRRRVRSAS